MPIPPQLVLASVLALSASSQASPPDLEGIAREYLASNQLEAEGLTFGALIDGPAFVRVPLGGLDVRFPAASLEDEQCPDDLEEVSRALIALQHMWLEWSTGEAEAELADDWKALDRWVRGWSSSKLRRVEPGRGDLYEQLGARDEVLAAQERLHARVLAAQPESGMCGVGQLVLAPTRRHFVQLVAVGGLLEPANREVLWAPPSVGLGATWVGWTGLVAMEYPAEPLDPEQPFLGRSIREREQTELVQHVTDRTAALLMRKHFARHGTQFFEESLGMNLVIGVAGKNSLLSAGWSLDWRRAGGSTKPYSRFVPGGNSSGGALPKRKAEAGPLTMSATAVGRYRKGGGEDFFVEVLRDGQKLGAKLVSKEHPLHRDRTAHFVLTHSGGRTTISAPFLGDPAEGKPLPPHEFLDDYEDLFRAYRALFIYWLRHHGAGPEQDSVPRFAELLEALVERSPGEPAGPVYAEVYEVPMSAPDRSEDSLEWRFLTWLAQGH